MDERFSIHSELITRAGKGDERAYAELYRLYSKAMLNTAYRIVADMDDAQDVLQDSFISAFRHLDSFRGESSFGSWLKRIVIHKSITYIQRKRTVLFEEGQVELLVEAPDESDFYGFPFTVEEVQEAIFFLPDGYRAVFSLFLVEGYDHAEIAEILGISESTSKSQLNRAKRKLLDILNRSKQKRNSL